MSSKFLGFVLIFFFFLLLPPMLFVVILGGPPGEELEFRLVVLFSLVGILSVLLWRLVQERRVSRIIREEREESLREGGIEEPRSLRELTSEEFRILHDIHQTSKKIVDNIWWLLLLFVIIDVAMIFALFQASTNQYLINFFSITGDNDFGGAVTAVFVFVVIIQGAIITTALQEVPRYLDLRSPVYRVQGRAIKEEVARRYGKDYYITVRRIKFSDQNYHLLQDFYSTIREEDEVAVEYSPRTKHVWKMYKTQDLK